MKKTCPECQTINEIDVSQFQAGDFVKVQCQLCGAEIDTVVPEEILEDPTFTTDINGNPQLNNVSDTREQELKIKQLELEIELIKRKKEYAEITAREKEISSVEMTANDDPKPPRQTDSTFATPKSKVKLTKIEENKYSSNVNSDTRNTILILRILAVACVTAGVIFWQVSGFGSALFFFIIGLLFGKIANEQDKKQKETLLPPYMRNQQNRNGGCIALLVTSTSIISLICSFL